MKPTFTGHLKYSLALLFLLFFVACGNENSQQDIPTIIEDTIDIDTPVGTDDTLAREMPVPGSGTITSQTATPLNEQNRALYKDAKGRTIRAVYYFDSQNRGIAILQRQGVDDITLYQELDEMPSNSAFYKNGELSWNVTATSAHFDDGENVVEYSLQKAAQ